MGDIYIAAYWSTKKESCGQCAERIDGYIDLLRSHGGIFETWLKTAGSKEEALKHEVEGSDDLAAVLLDKRHVSQSQKEAFAEMGFSFSLWNGREPEAGGLKLSGNCGSQHLQVLNSVILSMPDLPDVLEIDTVRERFEEMIEYWSPDSALVSSSAFNREHADRPIRLGAWMHYESDPEVWPAEVAGAETKPMAEGRVVELAESVSEIGTPEHVHRYKQVLKQKKTS